MKRMKFLLTVSIIFVIFTLTACSNKDQAGDKSEAKEDSGEKTTLHVAALESAYGKEMWENIVQSYEKVNPDVTVELQIEKNLEEVVRPNMQAGDYPDVLLLATNREEALTETLIKEDGVENITDVLDMQVPGEETTVNEKLLEGFTDTLATNPYADGETYLAPMFYSPTGLFYNAGLFEEKGWEVPKTWDEMWELGDKAKEEGIALFTYPTSNYFDTLIGSMLYAAGGTDFYSSAMTYEDGIWESKEATQVLETVEKLAEYVHPNTVANANPNDFTKNQQLVLDNKALFMPNGNWVVDEMKEAPRAENFAWGMASIPAFEDGGNRYAFTFFEQIWIPKEAENKGAAKEFIAYMYSDEAADTFLEAGAVQPIKDITEKLSGQKQTFYSIYDAEGVLPAMGTFASTKPVPGANMGDTLYGSIDSVISGDMTYKDWQKKMEEVSDKLRPAMN
ncbi:carbohydrate ABC transporter substrate-binding protein [Virgibacillus pantothenticus]|uniref:carbohydrate ABC transporter substrate-binding protein n=1 Tax=Virgibacillus pantothenticus TaxID=1473 RepID=UPI00067C730B|nr:carbohydrate ABC transporter substrate-binding protein [Virgibacillus pantothenticus]MBU8565842.1 carbohydrate ABC transporter substrate-binding protein [Virgibacillus pantothenticus]MBU8599571.1 carbohydrate ABC transporter substrate-binding protein [Virgibacillus pantothenticus]MBU8634018.1 carbohydrate ABC transporter substrate-binding protein [Virgibacillus pantothenticus]MBU8642058.1 carbohydrate ABC transporter substrate-binding protein [Virgibacillus pantothenticus]MBU8645958.1 carbo